MKESAQQISSSSPIQNRGSAVVKRAVCYLICFALALLGLSMLEPDTTSPQSGNYIRSYPRILAAPKVNGTFPDQKIGGLTVFAIAIPKTLFTDADGDKLTYSASMADGSSLPSWVDFDASGIQFNGIAPKDGNYSFQVTASDATASASITFKIIVGNAPPIIDLKNSYDYPVGTAFTITAQIRDPNGDKFNTSGFLAGGVALPSWLTYDSLTYTFKGNSAQGLTTVVELRAHDGKDLAIKNFTLRIIPELAAGPPLADAIVYLAGGPAVYTLPPSAFTVYNPMITASRTDNQPFPPWLQFFDENDTFVVYPHQDNKDPIPMSVVAKDSNGKIAIQTFKIITRNIEVIETNITNEFTINDNRVSSQSINQILVLKNGNIMPIWESFLQDGSEYGIYGKIITQTGVAGEEFRISTETNNNQAFPSSLALKNGSIFLVWQSLMQDGNGYGIYGKVIDQKGAEVTPEFLVNTFTYEEQSDPHPAQFDNGNIIVVWQSFSQDGSGYGIYAKIYDSTGKEIMKETQLNNYTANNQRTPRVAIMGGGNALVMWLSRFQDGDDYGIFGKVIDPTGKVIVNEFQINTYFKSIQSSAQLLTLPNGNTLLAWQSNLQDGSRNGIYAKIIDQNAKDVVPEFRVNDYTNLDQTNFKMDFLANGNIIFMWQSARMTDQNLYGIYAKVMDPNGFIIRPEFQVNDYLLTDQQFVNLAIVDGSYVIAIWESYQQDGDGLGLYGKILDMTGNSVKPQFQINSYTKGWQLAVQIAPLPDKKVFMAWSTETAGFSFDAVGRIARYDINVLPDIIRKLPDHSVVFNETFNFVIPRTYIQEYEKERVAFTSTQEDGQPLPQWLSFDPSTLTYSGTPQEADKGNFSVLFQVKDARNGTTKQTFMMYVSGEKIQLNQTLNPGEEPWAPEPEVPPDTEEEPEITPNTTQPLDPKNDPPKEDKGGVTNIINKLPFDWRILAAIAAGLLLCMCLLCCCCYRRRKKITPGMPFPYPPFPYPPQQPPTQYPGYLTVAPSQILPFKQASPDEKPEKSHRRKRKKSISDDGSPDEKSTGEETERPMVEEVAELVTIPDNFLCPLTKSIMADPWIVISEDQMVMNSYEREAIQNWFREYDIDPISKKKKRWMGGNFPLKQDIESALKKISPSQLKADPKLQKRIGDWIRRRGVEEVREDPELKVILENYKRSFGKSKISDLS